MEKELTKIALFQKKEIRKVIHNNEWWFVIVDIIAALTDSVDPAGYLRDLRRRDAEIEKGWGQIAHPLTVDTAGGPQKMVCANTEGIFRIIQSIPSPKAEPFNRWLAAVGYERVQEIEDPELATKRTRALYKAKGYDPAWIEKRMRGIAIREELTGEWQDRGISQAKDFAILTAEISKASFGMTPAEYKKLKGLERQNLRDHMNDLELIFSMLGEASTTEIARSTDAQGFDPNKIAAVKGGTIAGNARKSLEAETGKRVSTEENYLEEGQKVKRLRQKSAKL